MKIKFNKSLVMFIVAIIALFFFMSMRSNDDGKKKANDGERDGRCGWLDNKKVVNCKKSYCNVEPKKGGKQGTCGPWDKR